MVVQAASLWTSPQRLLSRPRSVVHDISCRLILLARRRPFSYASSKIEKHEITRSFKPLNETANLFEEFQSISIVIICEEHYSRFSGICMLPEPLQGCVTLPHSSWFFPLRVREEQFPLFRCLCIKMGVGQTRRSQ